MDAYLEGLEKARANGHDLSTIHSVASFFVSRVDTEIDKRLEASATRRPSDLQGQGRRSPTPGWPTRPTRRCSPATAARRSRPTAPTPQRPLWASTGVKNPDYRDTMYVTDLVGRQHRQHDAREDDAGLRRPRRGRRRPGHRPNYAEAQQVMDDLAERRASTTTT